MVRKEGVGNGVGVVVGVAVLVGGRGVLVGDGERVGVAVGVSVGEDVAVGESVAVFVAVGAMVVEGAAGVYCCTTSGWRQAIRQISRRKRTCRSICCISDHANLFLAPLFRQSKLSVSIDCTPFDTPFLCG